MRAFIKLLLFILNCAWVIPTQSVVLLFTKARKSYGLPRLWHRFNCTIFGLKVDIIGAPTSDKQTLFMSNHLSHLDITALGSIIPASFVSKGEVERWPLVGFLASLQQTVFIKRQRTQAGKQKNILQDRIASGDNLIIFPEGTSTDGRTVLPFKSSLFSLAIGVDNLCVQPISIELLSVDGKDPSEQRIRDLYAWHNNMDTPFFKHMKLFAQTHGARLRITFYNSLLPKEFDDRKALAIACREIITLQKK